MFAGKKTIRSAFALTAGLSMIIAAGACGNNASQQGSGSGTQGSAINVVSSINQWGSLAKEIGGNKVKVTSILSNPNVEAHEFEPKANDVAQFSKTTSLFITVLIMTHGQPKLPKAPKQQSLMLPRRPVSRKAGTPISGLWQKRVKPPLRNWRKLSRKPGHLTALTLTASIMRGRNPKRNSPRQLRKLKRA